MTSPSALPSLAVVHDDADAAGLSGRDAHVDAVHQIRPAGADVGPNTSEPLHSSCTRHAILQAGSPSAVTSPNRYTVWPPIGGRNTLRSAGDQLGEHAAGLLEQMAAQVGLGRAAARRPPGSHHTGSIATLVQVTSPVAVTTRPSGSSSSSRGSRAGARARSGRPGHRDGRTDIPAVGELLGERLADDVPVGIEAPRSGGHPPHCGAPSALPARYRSGRDDAACSGCRRRPRGRGTGRTRRRARRSRCAWPDPSACRSRGRAPGAWQPPS